MLTLLLQSISLWQFHLSYNIFCVPSMAVICIERPPEKAERRWVKPWLRRRGELEVSWKLSFVINATQTVTGWREGCEQEPSSWLS